MTGILAIVIIFGGLIFFHELGHFSAARMFGMGVKTFSLGFGPALLSFKRGKTVYQLAAVPLGGFVSLVGEGDASDLPEGFTEKDSFSLRPAWQRFCVIAAGPVFNLILAWFLCWALLFSFGMPELKPVIGGFSNNSIAQKAGLQPHDAITAINGNPITKWAEIPQTINSSKGSTATLSVERDGEMLSIALTPEHMVQKNLFGENIDTWVIGITPDTTATYLVNFSFVDAATGGLEKAKQMVVLTVQIIGKLVNGSVSADNIGGPIGIGKMIYDANADLIYLVTIAALISVNLGIMNLLPIPVLDGGHLFFLLIEMTVRRPVPEYIREKATVAGFFLLIGLMVFATYNDILRFLEK